MKNKVLIYWGVGLFTAVSIVAVIWAGLKYGKGVVDKAASSVADTLQNLVYPIGSYLSQGFSATHNGVDIPTPEGTPLKASFNGTVYDVNYNDEGGNQLIVSYPSVNLIVSFSHLTKSVVAKGDAFKKGDILAYSGNTGYSTGAHVHLTTTLNGQLVNPATVFTFAA